MSDCNDAIPFAPRFLREDQRKIAITRDQAQYFFVQRLRQNTLRLGLGHRQTPRSERAMKLTSASISAEGLSSARSFARASLVFNFDWKMIRYAFFNPSIVSLVKPRRLKPSRFSPRRRARSPVAL